MSPLVAVFVLERQDAGGLREPGGERLTRPGLLERSGEGDGNGRGSTQEEVGALGSKLNSMLLLLFPCKTPGKSYESLSGASEPHRAARQVVRS